MAPVTGDSASGAAATRVRLDLAYDGTDFHGWADQPGLRTVEGEVAAALSVIARTPVRLGVAGRTDAGVHARHQVAHADLPQALAVAGPSLVGRVNGVLARRFAERPGAGCGGPGRASGFRGPVEPRGACDVVVHRVTPVDARFDARFSAQARHYVYRICDRVEARDPVRRRDVLWVARGPLDVTEMARAGALLLGEHDFLSFCKPRQGATTVRTLLQLEVGRTPDGVVEVRVSADAFCHSMVRSIVGALLDVGRGRRLATWLGELLAARTRTGAAPVAPAHGLTLEGVDYPPPSQWAVRALEARQRREGPGGPGNSGECCG